MDDKRFIEETFPVKEVSLESAREKNIRHGHISTLHIWWARRPLASSRATAYAALIPALQNIDEWNKKRQFIIGFSKWENSLNHTMIEKAREEILKANGGRPPRVLDPFAGGGAIPLEAMRLGCETYASDLNPVAVLILKCTLEYPQKYGRPQMVAPKRKEESKREGLFDIETYVATNPLLEAVKEWGNWVLKETEREIGRFYPKDADGSIPVGYIWARTIPCQNPSCGGEIPLMRQFWLAKKDKKKVSLFPYIEEGKVKFKIVGTGYGQMPAGFDPENGTVARAVATCPVCGATVDDKTTRRLFQEGRSGERMVAVVLHKPGVTGKHYRIAIEKDMEVFKEAAAYLNKKQGMLMADWGIDPVPDEKMVRTSGNQMAVLHYGMNTFGDLFNPRQKLALITFAEKVRQAFVGSAIEVFGRYEKVMDYEGNIIRADRLLEDVRKIATDFAVRQILHNGFGGEISDLTRFYVLYRWNYGSSKVHFDEAQKLARSCGIDLSREWNRGFVKKEKEFIRLLGPEERDPSEMKRAKEMIDVLHAVLRHWEKGKKTEMMELLGDSGFGKGEAFYRVAQAISETLPNENKEKKLLDGFLPGRERIREEVIKIKPKGVQESL